MWDECKFYDPEFVDHEMKERQRAAGVVDVFPQGGDKGGQKGGEKGEARRVEHLRVPVALDTKRCISCTQPYTWSFAGRFQHCKTGLCETCWCVLAKSSERGTRV